MVLVAIDHSVAYDDRSALVAAEKRGEVGVLSAAGFDCGVLSRYAGFAHRHRKTSNAETVRAADRRTLRTSKADNKIAELVAVKASTAAEAASRRRARAR